MNLLRNLQFSPLLYSAPNDPSGGGPEPSATAGGGATPSPDPATTPDPKQTALPTFTADDVAAAAQKAVADAQAAWEAKQKAAAEQAAQQAAEKQGEFQKLYEAQKPQFEALSAENKALQSAVEATLAPRIEKLPENLQARVNALPLSDRSGLLDDLEAALVAAKPAAKGIAPATPAPTLGGGANLLDADMDALFPKRVTA